MPAYNAERTCRRAIQSVQNQTYKNIEIIIINDGSRDGTLTICKEFERADKRVKVIDKTNEGVSNARNAGLRIAKGKYVAFIDSDDTMDLAFIEQMLNCMMLNNADIVICGYSRAL